MNMNIGNAMEAAKNNGAPDADALKAAAEENVETAKESATEAAADAQKAAETAVESAKEAVQDAVDAAKDGAKDAIITKLLDEIWAQLPCHVKCLCCCGTTKAKILNINRCCGCFIPAEVKPQVQKLIELIE